MQDIGHALRDAVRALHFEDDDNCLVQGGCFTEIDYKRGLLKFQYDSSYRHVVEPFNMRFKLEDNKVVFPDDKGQDRKSVV
jgi:hypothetical protein